MDFDTIHKQYTEYICKSYKGKLHSGELLAESARNLLNIEKKKLDNDTALQREFLMRKIAGDLLRQVKNMGMTRQYDSVPILKEYTYLAYDLAYDYCEFKPDRRLLAFLAHVIYYEKFNENNDKLNSLKGIYNQSLAFEKIYIDNLVESDNPVYKVDIWGF